MVWETANNERANKDHNQRKDCDEKSHSLLLGQDAIKMLRWREAWTTRGHKDTTGHRGPQNIFHGNIMMKIVSQLSVILLQTLRMHLRLSGREQVESSSVRDTKPSTGRRKPCCTASTLPMPLLTSPCAAPHPSPPAQEPFSYAQDGDLHPPDLLFG